MESGGKKAGYPQPADLEAIKEKDATVMLTLADEAIRAMDQRRDPALRPARP